MPIMIGSLSAMLAKKGFTGPISAIEGPTGFVDVAQGGKYNIDKFTAKWERWYINDVYLKMFWSEGAIQGTARTTLDLVTNHDIKAADVAKVTVKQYSLIVNEQGNPVLRRPLTKESADHSMYYVCARMILDRNLRADQYTREKITDPVVYDLIDKITLVGEPSYDRYETDVEIELKNGKRVSHHVAHPQGHPFAPMTDAQIEDKFAEAAQPVMGDKEIKNALQTMWTLETLPDVGSLMASLVATRK
jgi:2-methylcitrate dehydratase PrpD